MLKKRPFPISVPGLETRCLREREIDRERERDGETARRNGEGGEDRQDRAVRRALTHLVPHSAGYPDVARRETRQPFRRRLAGNRTDENSLGTPKKTHNRRKREKNKIFKHRNDENSLGTPKNSQSLNKN